MDTMQVTGAELGRSVIPMQARDVMGTSAGIGLESLVVEGQPIVTKRVCLNLDKWLGSALDDGLTTEQALQELRGRPVPWEGSERDQRVFALPHGDALALLVDEASRQAVRGKSPRPPARKGKADAAPKPASMPAVKSGTARKRRA